MSSRIITLPPTTASGGNPAYVWADQVSSLYYDNGTTVNVGVSGNATSLPVVVTDANDAAAVIAQIQAATQFDTANAVVTGNPAIPSAPAAFALTPDYGQINLTWTADPRNQIQVWRGLAPGGETQIATQPVGASSYYDNATAFGTTYYYTIYAFNSRGSTEATNGELSSTPLRTPAPTSLVATPGYYQVALTWVAPALASPSGLTVGYYNLYRGPVGGPYIFITGIDGGESAYNDNNLPATPVEYVLTAVINNSESVYSNASNTTPTALAAPTVSINSQPYAIGLSWPAVMGATSYSVFRGTTSGTETFINSTNSTSYNDTPLPIGQGYFYYVTANANGFTGAQSAEVSASAANATFSGVSPQPASVNGGVLTFTGSGFDPSQGGQMAYGIAQESTLPVTYIDANTIALYYPGGLNAGPIQFYYEVVGSLYQLPFVVNFA